jgi:hypothetical protein
MAAKNPPLVLSVRNLTRLVSTSARAAATLAALQVPLAQQVLPVPPARPGHMAPVLRRAARASRCHRKATMLKTQHLCNASSKALDISATWDHSRMARVGVADAAAVPAANAAIP